MSLIGYRSTKVFGQNYRGTSHITWCLNVQEIIILKLMIMGQENHLKIKAKLQKNMK